MPRPDTRLSAQLADVLRKCSATPYHPLATLSSTECCGLCLGTRHRERDVARWLVWECGEDETATMCCRACCEEVADAVEGFGVACGEVA